MSDPRKIPKDDLERMCAQVAASYGIERWGTHYSEQEAARLLIPPQRRPDLADTSTLKRNRRGGRVPYVAYGKDRVQYMGEMLVHYILFGEKACLLWGGSDEGAQAAE